MLVLIDRHYDFVGVLKFYSSLFTAEQTEDKTLKNLKYDVIKKTFSLIVATPRVICLASKEVKAK